MNTTPAWATGSAAYAYYLEAAAWCAEAFAAPKPAPLPTKTWTGRGGQTRRYIKATAVARRCGLAYTYTARGYIADATMSGTVISSGDAKDIEGYIASMKLYLDADGRLHWNESTDTNPHVTAAQVLAVVRASL